MIYKSLILLFITMTMMIVFTVIMTDETQETKKLNAKSIFLTFIILTIFLLFF